MTQASECPDCGAPVEAADRFCSDCGGALPGSALGNTSIELPPPATGPMTAMGTGLRAGLPHGGAVMVVHRGPGQGTEYILDPRVSVVCIGRAEESDIFLDDVTVSRRHAEIRRGAAGWSIRDTGSLNGTYVNRRRVEDHTLVPGDEVQIGKFRFAFLAGSS